MSSFIFAKFILPDHTATSLQYYFPTRNRAIDWKLLIAGKENLDYLCVNNFLIK